jgi:hypothetical protein
MKSFVQKHDMPRTHKLNTLKTRCQYHPQKTKKNGKSFPTVQHQKYVEVIHLLKEDNGVHKADQWCYVHQSLQTILTFFMNKETLLALQQRLF